MTDAGFFRGTSAEQDNRFSDKEKKLLKQMRFGENVCKKVDMSKVKVDVLRPWISKRVEDLLGMEDDVVEEFVVNQLEANQFPDGRRIQINLTGFLNGKNARIFTAELWDMLLSAQEQSTGIPSSILESKQEEIKKRNEEQEKLTETLKKTVSRFNDKLKNERDSSPPLPSARSADLPSSSPPTRSNIKREKTSPEPLMSKDLDAASTTINRRKDDGGRRNYRARRSSSPSPSRRSRSRSRDRDRDRRDFRRDRDRDRSPPRGGGGDRDRRRDRSRSPIKARRSPMTASRSSYRDNRSRSRDRDRDRDSRPSAPINSNRRFSDFRDRERDNRPSRDMMERDRRRSRSREDRDRNRGPQRQKDAENGSTSVSQFRHPPSPPQQQHSRNSSREKEVRRFAPVEDDIRGPRRAPSNDREAQMEMSKRRERSPPPAEPMEEENSDHSGDSAQEDSPVAKKSKKDKKSKKEKKKHKKHKKVKKSKKSKNGNASGSDDDDDDEDNSASEEDENGTSSTQRRASSSNFLKYVDATGGIQPSSDDLERKLREKALESLKKANSR